MGPGATYATVTFLTGAILLLGWLYEMADNPRSVPMLRKSLLLFALPLLLGSGVLFTIPMGMWTLIACEEALKAFASKKEQSRRDKFWLVALFGVWELTVNKPFWGLDIAQSGESWDHLSMAAFLYATVLPVLMHTVTAAIYAFTFERRIWAALAASWAVHFAFNETAQRFFLSPVALIIETVVLGASLMVLLRWHLRPHAIEAK
jgi:hypothetical protein